jgi:hypothetical protein
MRSTSAADAGLAGVGRTGCGSKPEAERSRHGSAKRSRTSVGEFRDKGSNLDLHVQSAVSCRLDDPGMKSFVCLARPKPNDVVQATRLPFDPGSPSAGCAAARSASYVEEFWSPSLRALWKIRRLKRTHNSSDLFQCRALRVFLSQAGPRFGLALLQAEHHLWFRHWFSPSERTKATLLGRPRLACYAASGLARMPPSEGLDVAELALGVEAVPARQARGD